MPRTARRKVHQQHQLEGSRATGSAAVLAGLRHLKEVLVSLKTVCYSIVEYGICLRKLVHTRFFIPQLK